jgi:hypothetical protein
MLLKFVVIFDRVELMHVDPIYAPNHRAMDWKSFVEAEWSPNAKDEEVRDPVGDSSESPAANRIPDDDDDADWDDIVPDDEEKPKRMLESKDVTSSSSRYEVKQGGSTYYSSILDLRADKIRAAVKGSLYRPGVFAALPVRYEDLLQPYKASDTSAHLPGIIGLVSKLQTLARISPDAELDTSFFPPNIGCNGHICHPSINKMKQNQEYISYINNHVDWHAEQLMGYQKTSSKPSVERIVVLGERHSRAEWLIDRLQRCFPDIEVAYGFGRPGKFFQAPPTSSTSPDTLVIAVFINPTDWVEQMRRNPINAPSHKSMKWEDFLTSPWERTRSHLDSASSSSNELELCSFDFTYHEIIPCHTQRDPDSADFPLYELRHTQSGFDMDADIPYSNLLDLRADKIQNFLSTARFPGVVHLIKLRYEDLVWDSATYTDDDSYLTLPFPGIAGLLETIRDHTTLTPDASAGWILDETGFFKAEPLQGVDMNEDYVKFIEKHVNWSVEALIGYGL